MVKLIQVVLFVSGLLFAGGRLLGSIGVSGHVPIEQPKSAPGSMQAGVDYLNSYDKSRAQRQLDCAGNQYCKDPSLLDGSQPAETAAQ